jgi:hypothetical protein
MITMIVGSGGLEPPTSRLSGVCSNQLSYKPLLCITLKRTTHKRRKEKKEKETERKKEKPTGKNAKATQKQ